MNDELAPGLLAALDFEADMAAFFPAQVLLATLSRRTFLVGGVDEGSIMGPIDQRRERNKFEGDGANREFGIRPR